MNMPYSTAKDAVEFWQPVAAILGGRDHIKPWEVEDYTRDMLARCVLWLAERGYSIERITLGPNDRPWFCRLDDPLDSSAGFDIDDAGDCIFTAHREAVLAVDGEGDKQWQ